MDTLDGPKVASHIKELFEVSEVSKSPGYEAVGGTLGKRSRSDVSYQVHDGRPNGWSYGSSFGSSFERFRDHGHVEGVDRAATDTGKQLVLSTNRGVCHRGGSLLPATASACYPTGVSHRIPLKFWRSTGPIPYASRVWHLRSPDPGAPKGTDADNDPCKKGAELLR